MIARMTLPSAEGHTGQDEGSGASPADADRACAPTGLSRDASQAKPLVPDADPFASAVWEALRGDHNDLRRQAIILRAYRESGLAHACAHYDDALDMMFDGPDESDEGYARARWRDARRYVLAAQGTEARSDETDGLGPQGDGPVRDSECAQPPVQS